MTTTTPRHGVSTVPLRRGKAYGQEAIQAMLPEIRRVAKKTDPNVELNWYDMAAAAFEALWAHCAEHESPSSDAPNEDVDSELQDRIAHALHQAQCEDDPFGCQSPTHWQEWRELAEIAASAVRQPQAEHEPCQSRYRHHDGNLYACNSTRHPQSGSGGHGDVWHAWHEDELYAPTIVWRSGNEFKEDAVALNSAAGNARNRQYSPATPAEPRVWRKGDRVVCAPDIECRSPGTVTGFNDWGQPLVKWDHWHAVDAYLPGSLAGLVDDAAAIRDSVRQAGNSGAT